MSPATTITRSVAKIPIEVDILELISHGLLHACVKISSNTTHVRGITNSTKIPPIICLVPLLIEVFVVRFFVIITFQNVYQLPNSSISSLVKFLLSAEAAI